MSILYRLTFSTLMVLLTGFVAPFDCRQLQEKDKRQSVSYQSPDTESETSLFHHRAFHSCMQITSMALCITARY